MRKDKFKGRKPLGACPNCSAIWGIGSEEWDWQQCDACGWPNNDDEDLDDGLDYEDDYDQWCEDNNPNDSRNL